MDKEKLDEFRERRSFQEFYFLAIALLLAFGTLQTTGSVSETEKPVVTVVSCSMYPNLNVGDLVVVQGEEFSEIEERDVVVYDVESMPIPIVHRVIDKNQNSLETQGDNNKGQLDFEKNVTAEQIHGTQVLTVPRVGLVKILAMDLTGFNGDRPFVIDNTPRCRAK